ncbi:MAG: hypothetical protein ABR505_10085 [Actinomycetota bacterium]
MSSVQLVRSFLKAQNLEQLGDLDAAIKLYEEIIAAGFDAGGPYDRLIHIYSSRSEHVEVMRVAESALGAVKTYEDKKDWYRTMRERAEAAAANVPRAAPKARAEEGP